MRFAPEHMCPDGITGIVHTSAVSTSLRAYPGISESLIRVDPRPAAPATCNHGPQPPAAGTVAEPAMGAQPHNLLCQQLVLFTPGVAQV